MGYQLNVNWADTCDRPRDFYCVRCDSYRPVFMIEAENIRLWICEDCLKEFVEQDCKAILEEVYKTCWYCKHFIPSEGRHYAGECPFKKADCWHYEHCDKFEKKE